MLAATLLTVASSVFSSCSSGSSEEVEYVPVQITQGGAWAFIDSKGERVGTQEWEFEPTVTRDRIFTARTDSGLTVYRWEGTTAKAIDSLTNLASAGILSEGLMPVAPAMQRIRIVDKDGDTKFVLDPIDGKEISTCAAQFAEGLLIVNTIDGKSGVVDKKGNVIVKPKFSEISNFNGGYALARNDNFDDFEKGPSYFVIDKEGNETPVKGEFGYCEEGDCLSLPEFVDGVATVCAPPDSVSFYHPLRIDVNAKVTKIKDMSSTQMLANGSKILYLYNGDTSEAKWVAADGKDILKADGDKYLLNLTNYVAEVEDKNYTFYKLDGTKICSLDGVNNVECPGGRFGVFVGKGETYDDVKYTLYDDEFKPVEGATFYGVGTSTFINPSNDEIVCNDYVSSAYVDITAAATKLVQMATNGSVKGKEYYYIGQPVKEILAGENARFYSGNDRTLYLPTDSTGQLASGAGFWVSGSARSSAKIVAPTYQHYFEVHHYDYYGNAWGWNRTRQVGVHFNPSAKIESFDLQLRTNHTSGAALRESIKRRLKKEGYTLVATDDNYDEYDNGTSHLIIYGSNNSNGVGAIVGAKAGSMTENSKQALAASL